jgi:UDP-glucose 4,6-dehydratase
MNLLITGGYGFIASNFINYYFLKNKNNINILVNIDCLYYAANKNNIEDEIKKNEKYVFIKSNISNTDLVSYVLKKYNITHIIHFAAQTAVDASFKNSLQYTKDNVLATHSLLENCRIYNKLKKFIYVSTDEVYGDSKLEDILSKNETSILCPNNPYSATKAAAEMIVGSYVRCYNMPIIITRGNNVYGPNQYPEKIIPKFIKLLKNNKKVTVHGDGSYVRAFLHSYDTATAFELILDKGVIGEIYNIGCHDEYSIMDITKKIIKLVKKTDNYKEWIEHVEDRIYNDVRYFIDYTKLLKLGWKTKKNFDEELEKICNNLHY